MEAFRERLLALLRSSNNPRRALTDSARQVSIAINRLYTDKLIRQGQVVKDSHRQLMDVATVLVAERYARSLNTRDLTDYTSVYPDQATQLARVYSGRYATSPHELRYFAGFVRTLPDLHRQQVERVIPHMPPTLEDYGRLSAEIRAQWENRVRDDLLRMVRPRRSS